MEKFGTFSYDAPKVQDGISYDVAQRGGRCRREGPFPDISFSLSRRRAMAALHPPLGPHPWRLSDCTGDEQTNERANLTVPSPFVIILLISLRHSPLRIDTFWRRAVRVV